MTESKIVLLHDPDNHILAELLIDDEDEGWLMGKVIKQNIPAEIQKALAWYDEVLRDQMLSYLEQATSA